MKFTKKSNGFSFAKRYNTEKIFDIDVEGFEYFKLEDIWNELVEQNNGDIDVAESVVIPVRGIYINTKGQYGDQAVIATENEYINFPSNTVFTCKEILQDKSAIAAINSGKVGFTIYTYEAHNKVQYGIKWADID